MTLRLRSVKPSSTGTLSAASWALPPIAIIAMRMEA